MSQRYIYLILIFVLLAAVIWVDVPGGSGKETVLGLDLRGGLQVLLEADLPAETSIETSDMENARSIMENRAGGAAGTNEVVFQVAGSRRIVGEFPGLTDTEQVLATLKETGLLEFVDMGSTPLSEGTAVKTDYGQSAAQPAPTATAAPGAAPAAENPTDKVWHTIMTGKDLKSAAVSTNEMGKYQIAFELSAEGAKIFGDHTAANVGKYLAIVLDKKIISVPVINSAIREGSGVIEGKFTRDEANKLAIQLRYGALPIPFKIVESRIIGPTLGQDSLNKSLLAGLIGFAIVALFMIIYYRLPGAVAIFGIITYALITLAIFKLIPVTLTLPGIAGFLLSTGSALDANILIFERLKEELRAGRRIEQAITLGWKRALPSIRDSNAAALITSGILFWFGSQFGATIVKGFAVTLALGVAVSLFTAIIVTRTVLEIVMGLIEDPEKRPGLFGI